MKLLAITLFAPLMLSAQQPVRARPAFDVTETTIADIHAAMRAGTLTCHELVSAYLARIAAYDKNGPAINSIIVVNPKALEVADSLDRHMTSGGAMGALHCVPMIVKDNFETKDLPTTAGSLSLQGMQPAQDAFMVRRLREAGAIVLAKSNMAEFAFTPYETVSSILPGYTKNPYALDRVTAGSSGGSAAAVAASLGEAALGTDTGNSIRGPSSHQALVGIRSTMGLTSRDGVAPLNLAADIAGPMARSVADAVAIFQVVAGEDAADTVTARSRGHRAADYTTYLKRDALKGARIGVLHQAYDREGADAEVLRVFNTALDDLRRQGATIIDPVTVAGLDEHLKAWTGVVQPVQVRHRVMAGATGEPRAGAYGGGDHRVASLSSVDSPTARGRAGGVAATGTQSRVSQPRRISRVVPDGGDEHDGFTPPRCAGVSHVEQPAAADRRPEHAGRRQQPALLAEHGLSRDHGANGLHAWAAAGRAAVVRPRVERADADLTGIRVRAGDASSASAGECAAAALTHSERAAVPLR